ncbi:putative DNA modification/repair radical SAM protein [Frigoriglobus tundricola]|uniref:Biotin synthase related domain containing protein n=1 Tax=Frigoriglobus tundricola TaxID=2774151 RepID=A0A6M5YY75_9BACT|nr:putative DNA modification/repair radical SAM protein [Frigoriglobus tundricola]QJW98376.1 Biotin synthase related domain containing protein [Frigoriglobus tundricola]
MDIRRKLEVLADAAKYDASCASSGSKNTRRDSRLGSTEGMGLCHSYTPDGRCVSLLKLLLTNYCVYDCKFCVNRVSSDTPRARFTVAEVIDLTVEFYRRNYIEGLFLSSGIVGSIDGTMEQLVAVARGLREDHRFGGYIHLKLIPGASTELVAEAGRWADRLSANIELPTAQDLQQLAPEKSRPEIVDTMTAVADGIAEHAADKRAGLKVPAFAPAGQSTQMVVGATPTTDGVILGTADELYRTQKLRRVYYSAYSPTPHADARLPALRPPLLREHRLYQADWLLRFYGFEVNEVVAPGANLALDVDPKLAWALANCARFPVDVNTAPRELLLRIPGVGVRNVERILAIRRHHALTVADLRKLHVNWKNAAPFVLTGDHNRVGVISVGTF